MAKNGTEGVERYRADLAAVWRNFAGTSRAPLTLGMYARCMCRDANYSDGGRCKACGAFPMADWEWDLLTGNVNGFMESDAWASFCHGDGQDDYGNTCIGYADSEFPCTKCCAQNRLHNSGGFVETEEDIFPITLTVYLCIHTSDKANAYVKIVNVRESSITIEERKGVSTLVCESFNTSRIAYVPNAVWYTTEVQSGIQD